MTATTANRVRSMLERALRTVALLGLAAALYLASRSAAPRDRPATLLRWTVRELADSTATAMTTTLVRELVAAAVDSLPRGVSVEMIAVPSQRGRAMLGAVKGADVVVRWIDRTQASGLALSATAVAGPSGAVDVRVAGAPAAERAMASLVLRDAGGTLDSIPNTRRAAWRLASVSTPLRASLGASEARVPIRAPGFTRRVMLIAQPGWESKFVTAALEESGWHVDGRYRVSPHTSIIVGSPERLDTARYAVVVVLDSMAVDAATLRRFVQQGGGLVLGGDALRIPVLAPISPARATTVRGGVAGALLTDTPQRGLEAWELVANRGATVMRSDGSGHAHEEPVLVARRLGAGRVVASAYRNSWRWRMEGTDDGVAAHRGWWSSVLTLAAGVPTTAGDPLSDDHADAYPGNAAPYADLVARAGLPVSFDRTTAPPASGRSAFDQLLDRLRLTPGLLFTLIVLALLGEWASRRLRGNR
ncbi:hypothetical protein [Gemmatimonas sp.]|uniref:hypothetical protein n=1 Tax=Gemmatimonas sp. TaxID=1962908 RepID=UPI00398340A0